MSGLKELPSDGGGLRLDDGHQDGALRSDDLPAIESAKAPPSRAVSDIDFKFLPGDINDKNALLKQGEKAVTLSMLGLEGERAQLFAEQLAPERIQAAVKAFVDKKRALEKKAASFAHLKKLPPEFSKWFRTIEGLASSGAESCARELRELARSEVAAVLRYEAHQSFHVKNEGGTQEIDFGEWRQIRQVALHLGMTDADAESMALQACRDVAGSDWQPPTDLGLEAKLEERKQLAAEAERRAAEERRRAAEEQRRADQASAELRAAEARRAEEERQRQALRTKEAEDKRLAEEAAKDKARAEAEQAKLLAEQEAQRAEQKKAEVKQEEVQLERQREAMAAARETRELQQAVFKTALRYAVTGALLGLAFPWIAAVTGDTSTIALLEARQPMVASMPESQIRDICGVGKDLTARRASLQADVEKRVAAIAIPSERSKALDEASSICRMGKVSRNEDDKAAKP
jgi:DNA repair exonuclease SbcCD ATPase subunit